MTSPASHTENHRSSDHPPRTPWGAMTGGDQFSEQLLALADQLGAAFAEAYERISAAYAEAYQNVANQIGSLQEKLTDQQRPNWPAALASPGAPNEYLADAQGRTVAIGENLSEMGVQVGLAYLDAFEQATLAAAKCHEQIAETSRSDLLMSTATARADLVRRVAQAGASTMRDIMS
jgi:ABC-type phosphate/phosphonate transport system substrate-binding protein